MSTSNTMQLPAAAAGISGTSDLIQSSRPAGIAYMLHYRQGSNPYPQFFVFYHESKDMRIVVDRIKRHCEIMNLRFVNVKPLIVDLDSAEIRMTGQSGGDQ
jgi:hypothetical protein